MRHLFTSLGFACAALLLLNVCVTAYVPARGIAHADDTFNWGTYDYAPAPSGGDTLNLDTYNYTPSAPSPVGDTFNWDTYNYTPAANNTTDTFNWNTYNFTGSGTNVPATWNYYPALFSGYAGFTSGIYGGFNQVYTTAAPTVMGTPVTQGVYAQPASQSTYIYAQPATTVAQPGSAVAPQIITAPAIQNTAATPIQQPSIMTQPVIQNAYPYTYYTSSVPVSPTRPYIPPTAPVETSVIHSAQPVGTPPARRPICSLSLERTRIPLGATTTISWTSGHGSPRMDPWGVLEPEGSRTVGPATTTTYILMVESGNGLSRACTVTVTVDPLMCAGVCPPGYVCTPISTPVGTTSAATTTSSSAPTSEGGFWHWFGF